MASAHDLSLLSSYHSLLLSTNPALPLVIKTEQLSYPSPTAPVAATVPQIDSPSDMKTRRGPSISSPVKKPVSMSPLNHFRAEVTEEGIYVDAKFYSFEEFREKLEDWMVANHHPFRVASSEMLRESEGTFNTQFRYRYIVYHCAHYGNPRKRGSGKRPNQNYLPCGCQANLRLNYSFSERCLKITTLKTEHSNHEVSAENFAKCNIKVKRADGSMPTPKSGKGKKRARSPSPSKESSSHKRAKEEEEVVEETRLASFSPVHSSTPSYTPPDSSDECWMAPPPNLPAPTPQRPTTNYNPALFLMQRQLLMNNLGFRLGGVAPYQAPPAPANPLHYEFKFEQDQMIQPVILAPEDKENEVIDVLSEAPQFTTLQPVKQEMQQLQQLQPVYLPQENNVEKTISNLHNLVGNDSNESAARYAELQSLISKWGGPI